MRHRKDHRKLGRKIGPRIALMRSLTRALILYGRIKTTVAKAKEARRYAEKLVTIAKKGVGGDPIKRVNAIRRALSMLPDKPVIKKLFDVVVPLLEDRNGGYTRIVHLPTPRLGDKAEQAFLEFVVPIPRTKESGEVE
ncbi:MAG: 50S ribosomal protein L17 [Planctomycetota bacterium]|nr:MAG: 50S ribosomal protein L17 [Planctomycetota bacterium]